MEKNGYVKDMVEQFRENWLGKILKMASENGKMASHAVKQPWIS